MPGKERETHKQTERLRMEFRNPVICWLLQVMAVCDYVYQNFKCPFSSFQVLLSRLRLFLSPGYPYEEILSAFHNQTGIIMCSYLPYFNSFNRTKGV